MNETDEPRELNLGEVDGLSMQAIDQITARHPVQDYRTPKADEARQAVSWSSIMGHALR
jgi:hypothetical protein